MKILKKSFKIFAVFMLFSILCSNVSADPLRKIAKKMAKKVENMPNKKIAVLNFPYHNGFISSGSSLVQERLTTYLVKTERVEVVERHLLNKVLDEMSLERTGIIDENLTKELGKVLGVGGIVTGTLNDLKKEKTEVNARIIHTETGKILAAGRVEIKRTWLDSPVKPGDYKAEQPDEESGKDKLSGKSLIQLAILLDTSGSMDGLINQAKTQLWRIVNELSSSEKEGNNPTIQVALYEYGNLRLSRGENYLRQILPFTVDLDMVSEQLFALTTNGGQEYCGAVIMDTANNLQWDKHSDIYKVIFIAGNEPFTQGPVDFREAVTCAVDKDIFVNTIFCGRKQQGIATRWKEGADIGNGEYLNIDQQVRVAAIQTPQDAEIQRLGTQLNRTFIFYGAKGKVAAEKQIAQDKAAGEHKKEGSLLQRSLFKAKAQYSEAAPGDLVNEVKSGKVDVSKVPEKELPSEMRAMNEKERIDYVNNKIKGRKEIQNKINKLNEKRRKYIAEKRKEMTAEIGKQTLDQVISDAVRSQAIKKNFKFKE